MEKKRTLHISYVLQIFLNLIFLNKTFSLVKMAKIKLQIDLTGFFRFHRLVVAFLEIFDKILRKNFPKNFKGLGP